MITTPLYAGIVPFLIKMCCLFQEVRCICLVTILVLQVQFYYTSFTPGAD